MKQILQKIKQYGLVVLLVLIGNYGWGQISESFESGLPSSYNTSLSNVTLNSGTWQVKDVVAGTTGVQTGTKSAQIRNATAAQIITPTISGGVGTVSFYVTGSTASGAYQVNFSTDNGLNWTPATGSPFTIGKTKTLRTITINNSNVNKIQIYRTAATIYIDNFVTTTFAPTATSVSFSGTPNVGQLLTGSYTYNYTNDDAEGTSTFQWYRADNASGLNSEAISGATATTYTLQAADNGKYIRFGVVPVAASGTSPGVEAYSSWQGPVTDPTAVTATLTPSVALTEQNLNGEILTLTLENTTFTDATLDAANFTLNNAPSGVSISGVSYTNATTAQITLAYNDTDFDTSIANFSVTIASSELSAAQNLTSSSVSITTVTETLSVSAITSFGSPCLNSETTKTFTVSGTNLKVGNVSLASLSGFTYSLDNTNFTPTLTIASAGGTLAATTIHVKFVPTAVQSYNGNIVVSGVGAPSQNRSVVASGINTTPTITTPTSTSITASSAVLGGNVTEVGCNNITERGIYYSTTNGFADGAGTKVSETSGSYSTGTFTVNVTGLTSGTTYYYKAFATSASGTSYTAQGTFSTLKIEPANHPTNFVAMGVTTGAVVPQWTASVAGSQAPDGYLIKASTTTVADPVDGTDPANSTNISSGSANRKVTPGTAISGSTFTGMSSGTMYNYKIYPYTNTGTSIDFKITDAPSFSHATLPTAPTSPTVSNLQANTASLSWTLGTHNAGNKVLVFVKEGSAITTGTPTTAPEIYSANTFFGSGTAYQNDSAAFCVYKGDLNTVTISGLLTNTTYHVVIYRAVEATNSNGTNSYSAVLTTSFATLTNPVTLPYTQNFETTTSEWVLDTSGTNKWAIGSATNNGGTKALYISNDSGATNNYSIGTAQSGTNASVRVDLTGLTAATLSFDWKSNGELSNGTIYDYGEVYINTGGSDVLISGAREFYNTTTFAQKSIDISAYTGSIVTIKFRWVNDGSAGNQPPFAFDNLSIVPSGIPNFTTTAITNITHNSANTGGTLTTDGGSAITARGVVYATSPNPTIANSVVSNGSGNGAYTANLTGLLSNTTYYVRAYVTNANGTYYANEVSFTTANIVSPIATAPSHTTNTAFTANWNAVPGATAYEIDVYAIEAGANATDLFISEYVEGSSNNKYIEIFNGTGADVELSDYNLVQYNGGSTTPTSPLSLSGTLTNGSVYVIRNNSATIWTGTSNLSTVSTVMGYNGNDVIALRKQSSNIDVVGTIGNSADFAANATLRRNSNLSSPTTSYNVSDWTVLSSDTVDGLGSHTFNGGSSNSYILQNQNVGDVTSYQVTGLDQNTTYYYVVRALDTTSESINSNEIEVTTGNVVTTTWDGSAWSDGIPDETIDAVVEGELILTNDLEAKSITVNSGGSVIVTTGKTLRVANEVNNATNDATKFIVESGAALIQNNTTAENVGPITVKRYSHPLYRQDYTLWSSPVLNQNLRNFSPQTLYNRFYSYDTSSGQNGAYVQELFTTTDVNTKVFHRAKGYLIRMPNNWPDYINSSIAGTSFEGVFVGVPNTGDITVSLSTVNNGYNLVGNPYPSPISIAAFKLANPSIGTALYFYRKRNGALGSGYGTLTGAGYVGNGANGPFSNIEVGQGFFVKANDASSLSFTNSMRVSANGVSSVFLRTTNDTPEINTASAHRFWLNLLKDNEQVGQTLIGYFEGATMAIDEALDAKYFNDSPLAVTSILANDEYIIQARSLPFDSSDVVPLGFKTDVAGTYTFIMGNKEGCFEDSTNSPIFIKDNTTGAIHNTSNGAYTFTSNAGVFNSRFEIVYTDSFLSEDLQQFYNSVIIYKHEGDLIIDAGKLPLEKVEVWDTLGRVLFTSSTNETIYKIKQYISSNQVLILKITTSKGIINKKIHY